MTTRAVVLPLFLALCGTAALGHTFDRKTVEIFFVGNTGTFTVADAGECAALITTLVADPTIATVNPTVVTAVRQTFTVTARLAGTTTIAVSWAGVGGGCNDVGSDQVTVIVRSGPDLTIMKRVGSPRIRIGDETTFSFTVTNIGDAPTSGPITIRDVLAPGFRMRLPGDCDVADSVVLCNLPSVVLPLRPGDWDLDVRFFQGIAEGFWTNTADVLGGSDIRLTNNSSETVLIEVVAGRNANFAPPSPPTTVRGRR